MLKEGYGRAANTKGYITKQLMTWVDYGLERKRGRDSTRAVRGSLKLTIRLSTEERKSMYYTAS